MIGGSDALHDPRTFMLPIREAHVDAMRTDAWRHLLLYAALLPLCEQAGVRDEWDDVAAAALLDQILLATPEEVDAALRNSRVQQRVLVAHHADIALLEQRRYIEAVASATTASDWSLVTKWEKR